MHLLSAALLGARERLAKYFRILGALCENWTGQVERKGHTFPLGANFWLLLFLFVVGFVSSSNNSSGNGSVITINQGPCVCSCTFPSTLQARDNDNDLDHPALWMGMLTLREVKWVSWSQRANTWQGRDSCLGLFPWAASSSCTIPPPVGRSKHGTIPGRVGGAQRMVSLLPQSLFRSNGERNLLSSEEYRSDLTSDLPNPQLSKSMLSQGHFGVWGQRTNVNHSRARIRVNKWDPRSRLYFKLIFWIF